MTGGFSRKSNLSGGVTPAINVTPLVDVVLVLLIIFMVVAPQLDKDIALELPQIFNADPDVKTAEPLKISMPKAGEYYLDDQAYALDKLVEYLTAEHAVDPMRRLVVRADAGLKYKEVREFENRMQQVGFPGLSFVVNQKYRAGGSLMVSADSARAAPAGTDSATGEAASSEAGSENAAPVAPAAPAPGGN